MTPVRSRSFTTEVTDCECRSRERRSSEGGGDVLTMINKTTHSAASIIFNHPPSPRNRSRLRCRLSPLCAGCITRRRRGERVSGALVPFVPAPRLSSSAVKTKVWTVRAGQTLNSRRPARLLHQHSRSRVPLQPPGSLSPSPRVTFRAGLGRSPQGTPLEPPALLPSHLLLCRALR